MTAAPHTPLPATASPSSTPPTADRDRGEASGRVRQPPRRVDHTYRDYSRVTAEGLPRSKNAATFPNKLHRILSAEEFAHIISWMPHGRAWKIHNKELLMQEVVPQFFSQSKYESFTRQLNGWGFKRLHQSGADWNAYYHECFLRGLPHLTVLLRREKPGGGKLTPHVEGEPNFYDIDRSFPLPRSLMLETGGDDACRRPAPYTSLPRGPPPPPPPSYYASPPGDPRAAGGPPPGYPPPPSYPAHYGPPPGYYPYPPGPAGPPPYFFGPPSTQGAAPVPSAEYADAGSRGFGGEEVMYGGGLATEVSEGRR